MPKECHPVTRACGLGVGRGGHGPAREGRSGRMPKSMDLNILFIEMLASFLVKNWPWNIPTLRKISGSMARGCVTPELNHLFFWSRSIIGRGIYQLAKKIVLVAFGDLFLESY